MQCLYRNFILCVSTALLLCKFASAQTIEMTAEQQQLLGILTDKPYVSKQSSYLSLPGRIVVPPDQEYIISIAQSGIISKVLVSEGESVIKGQTLVSLSSPDLLHSQHAYLQASNQLQLELNQQKRLRPLWEDGVISERRWLELRSAVQLAQSSVKEQHSLLLLAGMSEAQIKSLRNKRNLLQILTIVAPNDGVILRRLIIPGQRAESMTPLLHLADLSSLWLEVPVPVQHVSRISINDQIEIQELDVFAKIILLGRNVDRDNQTVMIRALLDQPPPQVKVDQLVNVNFVASNSRLEYRVPVSAVIRHQGLSYVFVSVKNGFQVRQISISNSNNDYVIVNSGLSGNEQLAIKGVAALKAAWQSNGAGD